MTINTTEKGDILIVQPELNRLDVQSVPEFKSKSMELLKPGMDVVFDLQAIQFVDSTGLGALLSLLRYSKEIAGRFALAGTSDQAMAMFRLVKMTRVFDLYETVDDAVVALNG